MGEAVFKKIQKTLEENNAHYEIMSHKPVRTSQEAADARGTKLEQGVKALLLKTKRGFIIALTASNTKIDLKKLTNILKSDMRLATAQEVLQETDCEIGAVPPFGFKKIDTYMDNSVLKNEDVAFNAGLHDRSIKMKKDDLVRIVEPKMGDFSRL
jgi:Ala-tRNA(Pro) deacylase